MMYGVTKARVLPGDGKLFHPTAHLIVRFASDAETDHILGLHSARLRSRFGEELLRRFLEGNMESVRNRNEVDERRKRGGNLLEESESKSKETNRRFAVNSNILAWQANSGYVKETAIRNHILQSLVDPSHSRIYDHQADAMIILFKIAGATFEAFADPLVVDRCFEILKDHYSHDSAKGKLVQVCAANAGLINLPSYVSSQEVIELRERGPPSPTGVHVQGIKTGWHEQRRSQRDPRRHISGNAWHGFRTTESPSPSTRIRSRSRDRNDSQVSRDTFAIHQHRHPVRLHNSRHSR